MTGVSARRVLVVDDDDGIGLLLEHVLAADGATVTVVTTGTAAIRAARSTAFDVVLLDRWLPEVDGIALIPSLRVAAPAAAIIMLSAADEVDARVAGLRAGADDYITKPFHVSEVGARIDAVLRRGAATGTDPDRIEYADLVIDTAGMRASRGGAPLSLTPTELRLLTYLAENADRVLSRGQILDRVWRYDFGGGGEVVEKAVSNLRRKVDEGRAPLIQTVRGFGYCLRIEAE